MARKIRMQPPKKRTISEVFEDFVVSRTADGVADVTVKNYRRHLHSMSYHINLSMSIDELTRRNLDAMIVSMKQCGLAHNTISSYARVCTACHFFKSFF